MGLKSEVPPPSYSTYERREHKKCVEVVAWFKKKYIYISNFVYQIFVYTYFLSTHIDVYAFNNWKRTNLPLLKFGIASIRLELPIFYIFPSVQKKFLSGLLFLNRSMMEWSQYFRKYSSNVKLKDDIIRLILLNS